MAEKKHAGGRPPKLTPDQRKEVYDALVMYIARTPDPTIVGFVSWDPVPISYDVSDDNINDWEEFSRLRKRAVKKQEAFLLQAGGTGKFHPTMAIFRLKQPVHGYKDRFEQDVTSAGEKIEVGMNATQLEQLIRARAERTDS
jgi:hypothetical protein